MGYNTALRPILLSEQNTLKNTISGAHSFVAGDVIRYDVGSASYVKAQADGVTGSEAVGVIESTTSNSYVLVYQGEVDLSGFAVPLGSGDDVFYLSAATAGQLTPTAPTDAGDVIKVMLVRRSGDLGVVMNHIGTLIGGSSTVDLSTVQPVGTVAWYCGTTSGVPAQWSLCDGGTLDVATYGTFFSNIGIVFGYRVSCTAVLNGSNGLGTPNFDEDVSGTLVDKIITVGTVTGQVESATQVSGAQYTLSIKEYPSFAVSRDEPVYSSIGDGSGNITVNTGYYTCTVSGATVSHVCKPNIKSRLIVGTCYDTDPPRDFSGYTLGVLGGKEEHALDISEIPSHSHQFTGTSNTVSSASSGSHSHGLSKATTTVAGGSSQIQGVAGVDIGTSTEYAESPAAGYVGADPLIETAGSHSHNVTFTPSGTVGTTGSGEAHQIRPPYIALHPIVRVKSDGLASILEVASLAALELDDLANVNIPAGKTGGEIIVYSGASGEFHSFRLFTEAPTDASLASISPSLGKVGFGIDLVTETTPGILTVKGNTAQFVIIDEDSISAATAGGHLFESNSGSLRIFGCRGNGATWFNETLTIDTVNKFVGVGITTPAGVLDVRNGSNVGLVVGTGGQVAVGRTADSAVSSHPFTVFGNSMAILGATGATIGRELGSIYFGVHSSTGNTACSISAHHDGLSGSQNKSRITVSTNNGNTLAAVAVFSSLGRFGIGITSPDQMFNISGGTAMLAIDAGGVRTILGGTAPVVGTTGSVDFSIVTNNTSRLTVGKTGYAGFGISDPLANVHIFDATKCILKLSGGGITMDVFASGGSGSNIVANGSDLNIYTGGAQRLVITSAGNVGIGTASPAAKLEVSGAVKSQNTAKCWGRWNEDGTGLTGYGIVSVSKTGTGDYLVTHNLNTSAYAVFNSLAVNQPIGTTGGLIAFVGSQSGNTYTVQVRNLGGSTAATNLTTVHTMVMAF